MFLVDRLILLAAVLLLVGTVSSKLSARLGLPVLVVFVAVGMPEGRVLFNIVFFIVLVSATLQGSTLPALAARLRLQEPSHTTPPAALELLALRDLNAEIVDYTIAPGSAVAGLRVAELQLPDGVIVALISREGQLIPPRGQTRLESGDHAFVIARTDERAGVERVFVQGVGARLTPAN